MGNGVLTIVVGLADKVYAGTVEMLALYLATLVKVAYEDDDEDEDDSPTCVRCGEVGRHGGWLNGDYICYECMTVPEYLSL